MVDKNGKEIEIGQLVFIKNWKYENGRYFYIEDINKQDKMLYGKRVNKDLSFNRHDKDHNNKKSISFSDYIIEIIEPVPDAFKESIRILHFYIEEACEEFGTLISKKERYILRAVKYQNGSYGIIQNKLFPYDNGIDLKFGTSKVFVDLSYNELQEKWEQIKSRHMNIEWIEDFIC